MKFNKILLTLAFALILAFAITNISATVTVTYNVSSAIIEDNAAINITGSTLLNGVAVSVEGYSCLAVNCTTINSVAIPGLVNSTSTGKMIVTFPNNLPTAFGYVLYFHAPDYIGWEQLSNWNSPDLVNYTVNSGKIIYLSKKRNGNAPIMNLTVEETVPTNRPITVNASVSIDANTYSAIAKNTRSNLTLNETVETQVTAVITNSSNGVIYSASQTLYIPYSGSLPVNFAFPGFNQTGTYTVTVSTNITDLKILHSLIMQANAQNITVIPSGLLNYSYSEISNLVYNPALPRQNDSVNFGFNYFSVFVNATGGEEPLNTTLNISIFRSGSSIFSNIFNTTSNGSYNFSRIFGETGSYTIYVTGTPTSPRGNQTILQPSSLSFTVGPTENQTIIDDDDDDDHDHNQEVKGEDTTKKNYGASLPLNSGSGEIIDLTPKKETKLGYTPLLLWMFILVLLLLIAVVVIYILKFI
jgi:hypothetical protein